MKIFEFVPKTTLTTKTKNVMKIVSTRTGKRTICVKELAAVKINFEKDIQWQSCSYDGDDMLLRISTDTIIDDLEDVIDDVSWSADIGEVARERTEFYISVTPEDEKFEPSLMVTIYNADCSEDNCGYSEAYHIDLSTKEMKSLLWQVVGYLDDKFLSAS